MVIDVAVYWLIFAVFCFAMEAFGITGVGLFFSGLGAISVGVLMQTGTPLETSYTAQFAWFFVFTVIWAIVLWKPIKHYRSRNKGAEYSNMVGDRATVYEAPLTKGKEGQAKWSGAVMIAELVSDSTVDEVAVDEAVIIKEVKGNKLFVDIA